MSPVSTLNLTAPIFIAGPERSLGARGEIAQARSAIKWLETQLAVFKIEALFSAHPELGSFTFLLSCESAGSRVHYYPQVEAWRATNGMETLVNLPSDELAEMVQGTLCEIPNEALFALEEISFARPTDGSPLLHGLMKSALGEDVFGEWLAHAQRETLENSTPSAPIGRKPSASV